jgi:hypothetical protein
MLLDPRGCLLAEHQALVDMQQRSRMREYPTAGMSPQADQQTGSDLH